MIEVSGKAPLAAWNGERVAAEAPRRFGLARHGYPLPGCGSSSCSPGRVSRRTPLPRCCCPGGPVRVCSPSRSFARWRGGERGGQRLDGFDEAWGTGKLEDLRPNAAVRGVLADGLVTVVNVQWYGSDALELTYEDAGGKVANVLLSRSGLQTPVSRLTSSPARSPAPGSRPRRARRRTGSTGASPAPRP
jgi:hypothetical protein